VNFQIELSQEEIETIDPLTNGELEQLCDQAPESWSGERNKLIMKHMLYTGSRVGEVVDLEWKEIDFEAGTIDISPAKWFGERRLRISPDLLENLSAWRTRCLENGVESKWVFPNARGNKLSTRYIREFHNRYALWAGLSDGRIHPHLFRHTFASRLLAQTGNLRTVQRALGHASLDTTMIYLHSIPEKELKNLRADEIDLAEFEKKLPNMTVKWKNTD